MSKKDDMIAALECRQPNGAVPIWEIEFQAWDRASGKHLVLGKELELLSLVEQERALYRNAKIMLRVAEDLHYAAISVPNGYWEQAPGMPAYYCLSGEARLAQVRILRELAPADLMLIACSGGIIGMPDATQYVEFSYKLFDAPEEIDEMARGYLSYGIEMAKKLQDCGVDAVLTASDMADNQGPFFNPEQMDRFVLPYLREWAAAVRAMGLYSILHSDGRLTPYISQLADSGINALQAIDPTAGMEMPATKQCVNGKLCLCGNIDCGLLLTGTPDEVSAATQELLLQCKAGGGLVLGASNAVQPDVPLENYRAMIDAWRVFGQYA